MTSYVYIDPEECKMFPDPRGWYNIRLVLPKLDEEIQVLFTNGQIKPAVLCYAEHSGHDSEGGYRYFACPYDDGQDWDWNSIVFWREKPAYPLGFKVQEG